MFRSTQKGVCPGRRRCSGPPKKREGLLRSSASENGSAILRSIRARFMSRATWFISRRTTRPLLLRNNRSRVVALIDRGSRTRERRTLPGDGDAEARPPIATKTARVTLGRSTRRSNAHHVPHDAFDMIWFFTRTGAAVVSQAAQRAASCGRFRAWWSSKTKVDAPMRIVELGLSTARLMLFPFISVPLRLPRSSIQ